MSSSDGLSVGIPTYNQAGFIGQTIESLLNQKRPPAEIVVSDHFSTDDTAKVVQSFGSQVRYVQPPAGTRYAAQFAFTLAQLKSDWITLLSSDDIAYPNYVEALLRGAQRSPRAVFVRAAWQDIDAQGQVLRKQHLLSVKGVSPPRRNLMEQRYGPKASFAAFAIHREAWEQAGGITGDIESAIDWPMFIRLAPLGDFVYEPEIIAGYRVGHDGDKYRRRLPMWLRDEQRLFREYFPQAAARMKMRNTKWIRAASRHNFLRYLSEASRRFEPQERGYLVEAFEQWADSVGEQEKMRRFKNGETIGSPLWLHQRVIAGLRPIYARLKQ